MDRTHARYTALVTSGKNAIDRGDMATLATVTKDLVLCDDVVSTSWDLVRFGDALVGNKDYRSDGAMAYYAALCMKRNSEGAAEKTAKFAGEISDPILRMKAYLRAFQYSAQGSAARQIAAKGIYGNVNNITDPVLLTQAYAFAGAVAQAGSAQERDCVSGFKRNLAQIEDGDTRILMIWHAFSNSKPNSAMDLAAAEELGPALNLFSDPARRIEECDNVLTRDYTNFASYKAAIVETYNNAPLLEQASGTYLAYSSGTRAAQKADDEALVRQGVRGVLEIVPNFDNELDRFQALRHTADVPPYGSQERAEARMAMIESARKIENTPENKRRHTEPHDCYLAVHVIYDWDKTADTIAFDEFRRVANKYPLEKRMSVLRDAAYLSFTSGAEHMTLVEDYVKAVEEEPNIYRRAALYKQSANDGYQIPKYLVDRSLEKFGETVRAIPDPFTRMLISTSATEYPSHREVQIAAADVALRNASAFTDPEERFYATLVGASLVREYSFKSEHRDAALNKVEESVKAIADPARKLEAFHHTAEVFKKAGRELSKESKQSIADLRAAVRPDAPQSTVTAETQECR